MTRVKGSKYDFYDVKGESGGSRERVRLREGNNK